MTILIVSLIVPFVIGAVAQKFRGDVDDDWFSDGVSHLWDGLWRLGGLWFVGVVLIVVIVAGLLLFIGVPAWIISRVF
jgi:hypothetical protein